MLKNTFLLILFLFLNSRINAQNDSINRRELRPFGLSLDIMGPTVYTSLNFDYFLDRNMSLEVGGSQFGYYSGMKVHFGNGKSVGMPYLGLLYVTHFSPKTGFEYSHAYIPIGYHYVGKTGFNASIEIALNFTGSFYHNPDSEYYQFYPQFRLGYRFKRKKQRKNVYKGY
jgi:hypothetical protein